MCEHLREDIEWEKEPSSTEGFSDGTLLWFGSCKCGQRVTEQFDSVGVFTVPEGDEERVFISE